MSARGKIFFVREHHIWEIHREGADFLDFIHERGDGSYHLNGYDSADLRAIAAKMDELAEETR